MPALYLLNFLIFFIQYWVDKILVFNYYRKTPEFTRHLSRLVVNLLPPALVIHIGFGLMVYSYPYIWRSEVIKSWVGNDSKYFSADRMGQAHVAGFFVVSCVILVLLVCKEPLVLNWRRLSGFFSHCFGACFAKINGQEYDS